MRGVYARARTTKKGAVKMTEVDGKDFWTAEPSIGVEEDRLWRDLRIKITKGMKLPHDDDDYKARCCEQCNRLWAAYAEKRKKPDRHPYCGACMGYLTEEVLRILSALQAPCRYCGEVPWVSRHDEDHVTVSCENEGCAYYMNTDEDGEMLSEGQAVERWNYLNTGKRKEPRIKGFFRFWDQDI
jgi:hypothetical protein